MAAGLSLNIDDLHDFRNKLNEHKLAKSDLMQKYIDMELPLDYIVFH